MVLVLALAGVAFLGYVLLGDLVPGGTSQVVNVTVSGIVTAGQYAAVPVPSAVVHVTVASGPGSGGSLSVITDASGAYQFVAQSGSTYSLYASLGIHWGTVSGSPVTRTILGTTPAVSVELTVPASDIFGTITNASSGLPIGGATLSLSDPSESPWCCQVTGPDGTYLLWGISTGTYTLSVSAPGYATAYANPYVPSMYASSRADFPLSP